MKKNILFSVDNVYGYKECVEQELRKRFQTVKYLDHYLPPKNERSIFFKILREVTKRTADTFFLKKYFYHLVRDYYTKNILSFPEKMDYFLVVAGLEFSKEFIRDLKKKNPGIVCIIFLWDKLEYTTLRNSVEEFDYIFSFDREDCEKYNFIFQPSFFLTNCGIAVSDAERKYDISYIGALRDLKRYEFIEHIYQLAKRYNLSYFLKLVYSKKNKLNFPGLSEIISLEKISPQENMEILRYSKVVCEVPFAKQSGLTLRALQSIFFKNKIITLNEDIKHYDFYCEKNIKVIHSLDEIDKIEKEFFIEDYIEIDSKIVEQYTASSFIKNIFSKVEGGSL